MTLALALMSNLVKLVDNDERENMTDEVVHGLSLKRPSKTTYVSGIMKSFSFLELRTDVWQR